MSLRMRQGEQHPTGINDQPCRERGEGKRQPCGTNEKDDRGRNAEREGKNEDVVKMHEQCET